MKIRYRGTDDARDIALEGGFVPAPRMEWVDVPTDTARSLAKQDDWELEAVAKAKRTKKKAAATAEPDATEPDPPVADESVNDTPAEPANEENPDGS